MSEPFVLKADLQQHTSDTRAVAVDASGPVYFSASRDGTAASALPPAGGQDTLARGLTFTGHTAFVNFVLLHPGAGVLDGEPCLVTGGNDNHVALWNLESSALEAVLDGHAAGVCCGAVIGATGDADGASALEWSRDVVTGDWGGVCIVFDHGSGRAKQVYQGHKTAIRGVAHLPGTHLVVSASGDKTLHLWDVRTAAAARVYAGHEDVVQCVCAVSATVFASGSNDCTVRLWSTASPIALRILQGHESLVYTVSWNAAAGELLSASEDRTVRVWGPSGDTQAAAPDDADDEEDPAAPYRAWATRSVIQHPCVVWTVAAAGAREVLTGGSDGMLRLWTRDEDAMASVEKLEALQAAIAATEVDVRVAASGGGGGGPLDPSKMISVNELHKYRGAAEGEKKFVRNEAGAVEVYIWAAGRWDKVGVVVAGPDRQAFTGGPLEREKKYHNGRPYDYVFDVDVEGRMLKLPYNAGENIFEAAQNFINENRHIVTQDSKEAIQNFIMKHIDPQDLARVTGGGGGGTGATPASSAQPPAAAAAPQTPAGPPMAPAPVQEFGACTVFETLNAAAVQRKVDELLAPDTSFSGVIAAAVAATAPGASADARVAAVADAGRLLAALPVGQRFPALDTLRFLLAGGGAAAALLVPVLDVLESFLPPAGRGPAATSDGERLTATRLAANAVAVMDAGARAGDSGAVPGRHCIMLSWVLSDLCGQSAYGRTAPLRAAAAALLTNGARFLSEMDSAARYMGGEVLALRLRTAAATGALTALRAAASAGGPPAAAAALTALYTLLHRRPHRASPLPPALATDLRRAVGDCKNTAPLAALAEAVLLLLQT